MLQIDGVTKQYDNSVMALNGVDLTVAEGEIVCLLGPSGCGKTTLLRVVAGLELQDKGKVLLDGRDLSSVPVHQRNFGYMFQDFALFPHKSVEENVAFGLRMDNMPRSSIDARVDEMLELVGLQSYGGRSVFELSGGERQRVALARSLAPNPNIIMLDEPLGSLDRTLRETLTGELRAILKRVDVSAIYVTHDQEEAFAIADRVAVMLDGDIAQIAAPEEIYRRPNNREIARFLGFTSIIAIAKLENDPSLYTTLLGDFPARLLREWLEGEQAHLLIRPDSARLDMSQADDALEYPYLRVEESRESNRLRLFGKLEEYSFRGSQYRLVVSSGPSAQKTTLTFDLPAYQTDHRTGKLTRLIVPPLGSLVSLVLYPELMTILEDG